MKCNHASTCTTICAHKESHELRLVARNDTCDHPRLCWGHPDGRLTVHCEHETTEVQPELICNDSDVC